MSCRRSLVCVYLLVISLSLSSIAAAKVARYGYTVTGLSAVPYAVDSKTGRLRYTVEQDFTAPSGCNGTNQATIAPSQQFFYLPLSCGQMIAASIGANGNLTPIAGSPFAIGTGLYSFAVTPSGSLGYAADTSAYPTVTILPVSVNTTTGALAPLSGSVSYSAQQTPTLYMDPLGKFLFILDSSYTANIYVYAINATTGALTAVAGSPFATGGQTVSLATYPGGKFLVATNYTDRQIQVFGVNRTTGVLTQVTGSPFSADGYAYDVAVDPAGAHFVFVGYASGSSEISVYRLNATTGALTGVSGSPFATDGTEISANLTVDPTGHYLYAASQTANFGSWEEQILHINPTTGALTPVQTISNPTAQPLLLTSGTTPVVFTPTYLYAANSPFAAQTPQSSQDEIAEYSVGSTGALTSVGSVSDVYAPQQLALTPSGGNVWLTDSNYVTNYGIQSNGSLNVVNNRQISSNLILEDPNGAYLYLASGGVISDFTIDPSTQNFGLWGTWYLNTSYNSGNVVAVTTSFGTYGDLVLTANNTLFEIYRGSNNGSIVASYPVGNAPSAVALDGGGRFVYVANSADNTISGFADFGDGLQAINGGTPFAAGTTPAAIVGDPFGDFLYVANSGSHDVWAYSIDQVTGNLTKIGTPLALGNGPVALNIDYSGKHLYCANSLDGTISVFTINTNGTLKSLGKTIVDATVPTTPAPTSIVSTGTNQ